jgi:hypothetical protein
LILSFSPSTGRGTDEMGIIGLINSMRRRADEKSPSAGLLKEATR